MTKFKPSDIEKNFGKDLEKRGVLENQKENWEIEFYEKFWIDLSKSFPCIMFCDRTALPEDIKSFIRSAIQKEKVILHAGKWHYKSCDFPTVDQAVCNCPNNLKPTPKPQKEKENSRDEGYEFGVDAGKRYTKEAIQKSIKEERAKITEKIETYQLASIGTHGNRRVYMALDEIIKLINK